MIAETAVKLRRDGHRVIIVSSGAIGVALQLMNLERRPKHLPQVQALAAIGQCKLMTMWDSLFAYLRQPVAQILLTRNDIADRTQYLNAQNTLTELLHMGVIPIVNENDTLAVAEIKFGDNDTLSAITAGMVHADYLFLMTDVDCLYDKNPRTNPDAKAIEVVEDISALAADVSSKGSSLGTGGMSTKIVAARLATAAGVTTVITRSSKPGNIHAIVKHAEEQKAKATQLASTPSMNINKVTNMEEIEKQTAVISLEGVPLDSSTATSVEIPPAPLHTRFLPDPHPIRDRYFWLLHGLAPHGTLYIDEGAFNALSSKAGLLPVGVVDVDGDFAQQEAVSIVVVRRLSQNTHNVASPRKRDSYKHDSSTPATSAPPSPRYEHATGVPLEVGRAIVNYSAAEIRRIRGLRSTEISSVLGYAETEYVAWRENVAFFQLGGSRPTTPSLLS